MAKGGYASLLNLQESLLINMCCGKPKGTKPKPKK